MISNPRPTGFESWVGTNIYTIRLRSLHMYRSYPCLHPSGVVNLVPEQLKIKAVTGANNTIVDWWLQPCPSLALCSATVSVVSSGICRRNKVNSFAGLYRMGSAKRYYVIHLYIYIYLLIVSLGLRYVYLGICPWYCFDTIFQFYCCIIYLVNYMYGTAGCRSNLAIKNSVSIVFHHK